MRYVITTVYDLHIASKNICDSIFSSMLLNS